MKENEFLDAVSSIDSDVVARFLSMDDRLRGTGRGLSDKRKTKGAWLRFGAIAACFALILGAVIGAPMLRESGGIPAVSTVEGGSRVTGVRERIYGSPELDYGDKSTVLAPGFYVNTVVQADVVEVLTDVFYDPDSGLRCHVARLSVVDSIRGEGLPREIFFLFPHYGADILDGYDTFILSLRQVGIENYVMVNETKGEITYFSHMFRVEAVSDLGYGSVIAFRDGEVDESFWEKASHFNVNGYIEDLLADPESHFPVSHGSTLEEAKANIVAMAQANGSIYVSEHSGDYLTAEDVFHSAEGEQARAYLEPSESNVFMQKIDILPDRIVATYTRLINGFVTDETVTVNGYTGEDGNVSRRGEAYNAGDLSSIPNIGEALENLNLSELKPPHTEIADGMYLKYSKAIGVYRKVDGEVYGIVRVTWCYTCPGVTNGYRMDDCYYLYDENGNGSTVERDELRALLGDDPLIPWFSYDPYIGTWK